MSRHPGVGIQGESFDDSRATANGDAVVRDGRDLGVSLGERIHHQDGHGVLTTLAIFRARKEARGALPGHRIQILRQGSGAGAGVEFGKDAAHADAGKVFGGAKSRRNVDEHGALRQLAALGVASPIVLRDRGVE